MDWNYARKVGRPQTPSGRRWNHPAEAELGPWNERRKRGVEAAFVGVLAKASASGEDVNIQTLQANNPKWNKNKKPQRRTCQSSLWKTSIKRRPRKPQEKAARSTDVAVLRCSADSPPESRPRTEECVRRGSARARTRECYSTVEKNGMSPCAATRTDSEIIIIREVSQRKTGIIWCHLYVGSKIWREWTNLQKQKQTHRQRKQTYGYQRGKGVRGEASQEAGIIIYTRLSAKSVTNKDLLNSTGSYARHFVRTYKGKESELE